MFGILDSISDSYYFLAFFKKEYLFTAFIWSIASGLVAIAGILELSGSYPFGFMLSGALLFFLGAAPAFRLKLEGTVHVIGATGGILTAMLEIWRYFSNPWILLSMIAVYLVMRYFKIENMTWWVEMSAFVLILVGLIIR
jgi:hypothetical protein